MKSVQVVLDCEGPITQNDNAFELCEAFLPNGGEFFSRISLYDDFLADIDKRSGYKAGDTLKLILPFFKAFGITNDMMQAFSTKTLVILPYAKDMLQGLKKEYNTFIISTSYRQYLEALCKETGFDMQNVYCTDVDMDTVTIGTDEAKRLKTIENEIVQMPTLNWSHDLKTREDLPADMLNLLNWLDGMFWQEIPAMQTGKAFSGVNPIGGREKANSLKDSILRTGNDASSVLYAGDSITDVQALSFARKEGGVALSFNGNRYALQAANYACISPTPYIILDIAKLLSCLGTQRFSELFDSKPCAELDGNQFLDILAGLISPNELVPLYENASSIKLFKLNGDGWKDVLSASETMRKRVRGQKVGELG